MTPHLIQRLLLGHKLTPAQEDGNIQRIEDAIDAFAAELAVSLNPDGTLKANSVATAAIQDRAVTLAKLAFLSSFYAVDAGAVNAMAISFTPACAAYEAGDVFWVKVVATNTGASTLAVDALVAISVKSPVTGALADLVAGNLIVGGVYGFVYDGTQFVILNPTPPVITVVPVINDDTQQLQTRLGSDVSFFHGLGVVPFSQWFIVCTAADGGYNVDDEVDVDGVWTEAVGGADFEPLVTHWANSLSVVASVTPIESGIAIVTNKASMGTELVLNGTKWKLRNKCIKLF